MAAGLTCEEPSGERTAMAPRVSGSTPIAHPLGAAASAPELSSAGSSERDASQGSRGSASARSFARSLALAPGLGVRVAAAGAGARRQRQRRGRKGGEKKDAAEAADQCGAERRRAAARSAFMGSWLADGAAVDAAPAAAAAAAIIRMAAAGWEGEGFACFAAGES
nr:unnamed protein product [Digitaria exilis]